MGLLLGAATALFGLLAILKSCHEYLHFIFIYLDSQICICTVYVYLSLFI